MLKFSSGPCAKNKEWRPINSDILGRSHRSEKGLMRIQYLMSEMRDVLEIPNDYYIGIISGSATGAVESLLWSLIGARGVDAISASVFGEVWKNDIEHELGVSDIRSFHSEFGTLHGLDKVDFDRDVVFCWTETPSGVSVNHADWIADQRQGLTICDATSSAFCAHMDWQKLDATAFSWQKGLGGEAGFGTIVLSPRAIERLQQYIPNRPMPKIYRIAVNGTVNFGIFEGKTINTPSMMCIEECISNLQWAHSVGNLSGLVDRVSQNYEFMKHWEESQDVFKFYVKDESVRCRNVLCFDVTTANYQRLSDADKWNFLRDRIRKMESDGVACDILGHILTVPHIRIWCGPTIETSDLEVLTKYLTESLI